MFGGKLRSQIRCEKCDYTSDTFDETFALNLPLPRGKEALFGEALSQFFSVDKLVKDNKYKCPVCKSL
jgi:ubiquitin C-terminal hydrolase